MCTPNSFSVRIGTGVFPLSGTPVISQVNTAVAYTFYSATFTATSATPLLQIGGRNDPAGIFVDDIAISLQATTGSVTAGEGTSGTQQTAFSAANMFAQTMQDQMGFWVNGDTQDTNGVAYGGGMAQGYAPEKRQPPVFKAMAQPQYQPRTWRVWAAGFGGSRSLDGEASTGSASLSHSTYGGSLGFDYQVNPNLLVGFAAGGSGSNFSVADRATSGDINGGHVGVYGVAKWGAFYTAASLNYGRFDNKTTRSVSGETETGSFASDELGGRLEVGWRQTYDRFSVTPFAAIQFSELWQRGYSETSTGMFGMTFASRTVSSLPTFLGAQIDTRIVLANGMTWSPFARVAWVHEFDPNRQVTPSFINMPGASVTVDGARAASDAAKVDVGSRIALNQRVSLYAAFNGEFSSRSQGYAGTGGLKASW